MCFHQFRLGPYLWAAAPCPRPWPCCHQFRPWVLALGSRRRGAFGPHIGVVLADVPRNQNFQDSRFSRFQDFKISRFQDFKFSRFQDFKFFKISRFQDFKISKICVFSRFQDFKIFKKSRFQAFKILTC